MGAQTKNAVTVETESGRVFLLEVGEEVNVVTAQAGGMVAGGKAEKAIRELCDVGDTIAEVCRIVYDRVSVALGEVKPGEMTLEFGVKLAGKAGIPLVTEGSAEGTFKVSAKWKSSEKNNV